MVKESTYIRRTIHQYKSVVWQREIANTNEILTMETVIRNSAGQHSLNDLKTIIELRNWETQKRSETVFYIEFVDGSWLEVIRSLDFGIPIQSSGVGRGIINFLNSGKTR